jgi:hypothetical protein
MPPERNYSFNRAPADFTRVQVQELQAMAFHAYVGGTLPTRDTASGQSDSVSAFTLFARTMPRTRLVKAMPLSAGSTSSIVALRSLHSPALLPPGLW